MNEKHTVVVILEFGVDLTGKLNDVCTRLSSFNEKYPEYSKLELKQEYDWDANSTSVRLVGTRFENDAECRLRLKREAKVAEVKNKLKTKKEEKERLEYERLKKKFGEE